MKLSSILSCIRKQTPPPAAPRKITQPPITQWQQQHVERVLAEDNKIPLDIFEYEGNKRIIGK